MEFGACRVTAQTAFPVRLKPAFMTTTPIDRSLEPSRLVRGLVGGGGESITLDALVSGWMARHFSAQVLFEQLGPMLLYGDLVLIHDPEHTRVRLGDNPPHRQRTPRSSERLSRGEAVEFAAAVVNAQRARPETRTASA